MISILFTGCSSLKWDYNQRHYKHQKIPNYPGYEDYNKVYISPIILDFKRKESLENYEYSYQIGDKTINKKIKLKDTVRLENKIRLQNNFSKVNKIEDADFYVDFEILKFEYDIAELVDNKNKFNDICSYKCNMQLKVKIYGNELIDEKIISKSGTINHFCMVQLKNKEEIIHPYWLLEDEFIKVKKGYLKAVFLRKFIKSNLNFTINNWLWETKIHNIQKSIILVEITNKKKDQKRLSDLIESANNQFYSGADEVHKQDPTNRQNVHIDSSIFIWKKLLNDEILLKPLKEKKRKHLKGSIYYNIALGDFLLKRFSNAEKALKNSLNYKDFLDEEELGLIKNLKKKTLKEKPVFAKYINEKQRKERIKIEKQSFIDSISLDTNGIELKLVEKGCFNMGQSNRNVGGEDYSNDEQPVHRVCLNSFYISDKEITIKQYLKFLNSTNVTINGVKDGIKLIDLNHNSSTIKYEDDKFIFTATEIAKSDSCPVTFVTWFGAKSYAKWIGGRLPTEAEWEYAASGNSIEGKSIYSGSNIIDSVAWYGDNSDYMLKKGGLKKPNSHGLYDMSGNADEWCADWYNKSYYSKSPIDNPQGPTNGNEKVYRGGSCFSLIRLCRITNRNYINPLSAGSNLGFRVVFDEK
ncbi:MAG: formylglycine-generating enzyme family protein [archaeon]